MDRSASLKAGATSNPFPFGSDVNDVAPASCCSGVTSSMIQNDRPIVEMTRSLRWTRMSVTGVAGRFCCSDCQRVPLSNETNAPNSVPA